VADEVHRSLGEILGQVISALGPAGRVDGVIVVEELGMELVGLRLQKAVEAIESSLQWPVIEGVGRGRPIWGSDAICPRPWRHKALIAQDLCNGGSVRRDVATHVRKP
jgi:hypothetical protein